MARGSAIPKQKNVDMVITSARYASEDGRVVLVQAYRRHGPVWSDIQLYDREHLVDLVQAGKRVVTGHPKEIPGDFRLLAQVRLIGGKLVVDGRPGEGETLGVSLF